MSEKDPKGKLNIELPEDVATGVYANLAVITPVSYTHLTLPTILLV